MEFLFQNPLILFILFFVLANVFKSITGSSKKNQQQQKQAQQQRRSQTPKTAPAQTGKKRSLFDELKHQFEEAVAEVTEEPKKEVAKKQASTSQQLGKMEMPGDVKERIEAQQSKQYKQFKKDIIDTSHSGFDEKELNQDFSALQRKKEELKKERVSIQKNLTNKGLKESMVMLEVLGPPRALRPYRSVYQDRYRSK